jgi:UDP-N-acetylmuramyl pentapeptide phosphotransferase/UDP-N-acetylglucosamine-1-phosphate transferase
MLAMVLHESGHALTAWLTGRWAVPMLWVTMHGEERSWAVVLALTSAIAVFGFFAWRAERWGWVGTAAALFVVQLIFLRLPAGAAIVFGGDAGAMVLATFLMAAFYAPRESALFRSWGLRWGLLVIGALAFMYVFASWSGPYEDIPFGEIEGVNLSDPSLLTELYGWSVTQLVDRYLLLAKICFFGLAALYVWGLVSAYMETRLPALRATTE